MATPLLSTDRVYAPGAKFTLFYKSDSQYPRYGLSIEGPSLFVDMCNTTDPTLLSPTRDGDGYVIWCGGPKDDSKVVTELDGVTRSALAACPLQTKGKALIVYQEYVRKDGTPGKAFKLIKFTVTDEPRERQAGGDIFAC